MRVLWASIVSLVAGVAHAAPVIVDFDGGGSTLSPNGGWTENGMVVLFGEYYPDEGFYADLQVGAATGGTGGDAASFSGGTYDTFFLFHESSRWTSVGYVGEAWLPGLTFTLNSLDLCTANPLGSACRSVEGLVRDEQPSLLTFIGRRSDGIILSDGYSVSPGSSKVVFDETWTDLERVYCCQ